MRPMLKWPKGSRTSDGVWAKHWYENVDNSEGFASFSAKDLQLNDEQLSVVHHVQPFMISSIKKELALNKSYLEK